MRLSPSGDQIAASFAKGRVHVRQAHAMIGALQEGGGEVEAHLYKGEVHGFIDERNEIDFYAKLATFFERNLEQPTDVAAPDAP